MTYKIGIFGSRAQENEQIVTLGRELGSALAQHRCIVITGGCSGMPYIVAQTAAHQGAEVWGFTPALNREEQKKAFPDDDITIYTNLIYAPQHYQELFMASTLSEEHDWSARLKYRNVISTINCDAGIIIAGGWGTLNEFTNLIYDGKPIGVLRGSGGLADGLPFIYPRLRQRSTSAVLFGEKPDKLVSRLINILRKKEATKLS